MSSHNFTITQESVNRSFTITQDGDSRLFTINTGVGPAGESVTVDQTIIDGSTNAVSGNAVFDELALKAPIANPTFTGIVTAPRITGRCDGLEVLCKAGLAINAGQVVYVTGASGNNIIIGLAQANAELTSSKTIGVSESTLATNGTGYVITEGLLTVSISAPAANEGDPIWLSPTTAGGMVFGAANRPVAPNHMVYLGVVTRKTGNTIVEIFVKVQNGSELEELADVSITSPTAGQALMRGATLWQNRSLVSADITDATSAATPDVIVKRDSQGRASFAATGFGAAAVTGTSADGPGVNGVSTSSAGLIGTSTTSNGVSSSSTSGTGLSALSSSGTGARTRTVSGTNHHEFGTISGDDRSFVRRVLGLFGWNRGSFVQTLGSPSSLTADSAIVLPDIASGTVALTSDSRFTDERVPTSAGIASKINGATAKTTLVDADETVLTDSAASFGLKKVTWLNVWNYIVTKIGAITSITAGGAWSFSSTTRPTSSGTGQATATSLVHLRDVDLDSVDFGKISYRDDFIGISAIGSSSSNISVLGWSRFDLVATNTIRPVGIAGAHGTAQLLNAAAFRAGQTLSFASSGITGAFGFFLTDLINTTTRMVTRFQISSLNTRFDYGFGASINSVPATSTRKFVINYTKESSAWTATTAITLNSFRRPTVANGRRYYASVGGTTGASEPTWPTTNGGTVVDGTVTWTEYGRDGSANFQLIQHTTAGETAGVTVDTGIAVAAATWYVVLVEFVSGSQWRWTINGTPVLITTGTIGVANYQPYYCIENSDAIGNSISIDYFGLTSRFTR